MDKIKVDVVELESLQYNIEKAFNLLLSNQDMNGSIVTGIKISSGEVSVYKNNSFKVSDRIDFLIEANQDDINMEQAEKFLRTIPKISIIGSKAENNRKFIVAYLERRNFTDKELDEDNQFQGLSFFYHKKMLYIDTNEEALKDPRPMKDKMAELQVNGIKNYAIYKLIEKECRKGIYMDYEKMVYKINDNGESDYIGQLPQQVEFEKYLKILDFENFCFPAKTINYDSRTVFITIPNITQMTLQSELKKALKQPTGIIILDSLDAYDLVNSDIIEKSKYKQVWYSGVKLPSKSMKIKVTPSNDFPNLSQKSVEILKSASYNWIIDDINVLTAEQMIELSDDNLVIVGGNLKDIKVYFSKLDTLGKERYKFFVNRCIYIGSMYTKTGKYLNQIDRDIIIDKEFTLMEDILKDNIKLEDLLLKIYSGVKDCKEINVKNKEVLITRVVNGKEEESIGKGATIENNDILQMIFRNEQNKSSTVINYREILGNLYDSNSYTSIISKEDHVSRGFTKNLKINVFKSGNEMLVRARSLINPENKVNFPVKYKNGASIILFGGREAGKTTTMKSILFQSCIGKKVYVYDPDYDITASEYRMAENMILDRNSLRIELLKPYDPDLVVINSDITSRDYMDIIMSVSDKTIIIIASSYDIVNDILTRKDIYFDSYKIESLLSRSLTYDMISKSEMIPVFDTEYFKDRVNPFYKEIDFKKIYDIDRNKYYVSENRGGIRG